MPDIFRTITEIRWLDGSHNLSSPLTTTQNVVTSLAGATKSVDSMRMYYGNDDPPSLVATMNVLPNPAARGATVTFTANANGGVPPYTFAFTSLDPGMTLIGSGNIRTAGVPATGTSWRVNVTATDSAGTPATATAAATVTVATTTLRSFPGVLTNCRVGLRMPDSDWAGNIGAIGPGVTARRIYCNFVSSGDDGEGVVIQQALDDGMIPVVSYKGIPSDTSMIHATADFLQSFGQPIAVARWHEPRNDTTLGANIPAQQTQWRAMQAEASPIFRAKSNLSFGCVLNGFLISTTSGKTEIGGWIPDADLIGSADLYDWIGHDSYQASPDALGNTNKPWPGDRFRDWSTYLHVTRGHPEYRILVGEYNGFTHDVILDAGDAALSDPSYWCICLFDSTTGGKGIILTHDSAYGDRLAAYQATLADPRAA